MKLKSSQSVAGSLFLLLSSIIFVSSINLVCIQKEGDKTNLTTNLPNCATNISNFSQGINISLTPWDFENETDLLPPWIDIPLAIRGQQFAIDRVAGVAQAYLYGLLLILANPQISHTLLFTGNTNTVKRAGKRYAATILQIVLWIRRALSDQIPEKGNNWVLTSIAQVRRIHAHAELRISQRFAGNYGNFSKNLKSLYSNAPIDTNLWTAFEQDLKASGLKSSYPSPLESHENQNINPINQLTFATTQWAFLGLILMDPESVNVYNVTEQGLDSFAHLWAVLGYSLGIRDEFNLGLRNNRQELKELNREFFKTCIAPYFFNLSHESKFLMEVYIKSAARVVIGLDPEYILRGILRDVFQIRYPRHMNARRGLYGLLMDLIGGNIFIRFIHAIFPPVDQIISPLGSLYHFVVGFVFFGGKYRSDEDIAKYCYFYEF